MRFISLLHLSSAKAFKIQKVQMKIVTSMTTAGKGKTGTTATTVGTLQFYGSQSLSGVCKPRKIQK